MAKNIYEAIKNLPEDLLTSDIIDAGIKEGHIQLIDVLPTKHLTKDVITKILSNESYSFYHFDLNKIPVESLNQYICDVAVQRQKKNYLAVPEHFKSQAMLLELVVSLEKNLYLLTFVPTSSWTDDVVYKGLNAIGSSSFNNSGYYLGRKSRYNQTYKPDSKDNIRHMQVFLTFVPDCLKNKKFYQGLFGNTKLRADDINFLTPGKFKDKRYYMLMSSKDISLVPSEKYTYEGIMSALKGSNKFSWTDIFNDDSKYKEFVFRVMDEAMADEIAGQFPSYFTNLPLQFQTSERLLLAIENSENNDSFTSFAKEPCQDDEFYEEKNKVYLRCKKLLTRPVCFALIKRGKSIPLLPISIWDNEFIEHCLQFSRPYCWIEQMPQKLQTQEFVNRLMDIDVNKVQYVLPGFINSNLAMKVFRADNSLKKYLPRHFFNDFHEMTGLPDNFYGGETTYSKIKVYQATNTYCRIGNCFLGFHKDDNYNNSSAYVTMTRSESGQKPEIVFSRRVQSFHANWLEKMVADYDRQFVKPSVSKALKEYQSCPYYEVSFDSTQKDVDIYCNKFCGAIISFVTKINGNLLSCESRTELIANIKSELQESIAEAS